MVNKNFCISDPERMSFLKLRALIGVLGILLVPIILFVSGKIDSISYSYYTSAKDFFVGIMCVVGCFFLTDSGYDWKDYLINKLTGIMPILIALNGCNSHFKVLGIEQQYIHDISATIFFFLLGFISIFLFTKHSGEVTYREKIEDWFYRFLGLGIWACLIMAFVSELTNKPIFWWESVMVICFGLSWLIKGTNVLVDKSYE